MINKYLALALSAFYLSNFSMATDIKMKDSIEEENKIVVLQSNNLNDSFEDEEQQKRFIDNKEQMKLNLKLAEKRLGLDKKEKEFQKK